MKFCKHAKNYIYIFHKLSGFISSCVVMVAFLSCSFGNSLAQNKFAHILTVQDVYEVSHGTIVRVNGIFKGWNQCSDNTIMKTRSDWTLTSDGRCIYVTGKRPKQTQQDKVITIKARVILEDDKAYLQYLKD